MYSVDIPDSIVTHCECPKCAVELSGEEVFAGLFLDGETQKSHSNSSSRTFCPHCSSEIAPLLQLSWEGTESVVEMLSPQTLRVLICSICEGADNVCF